MTIDHLIAAAAAAVAALERQGDELAAKASNLDYKLDADGQPNNPSERSAFLQIQSRARELVAQIEQARAKHSKLLAEQADDDEQTRKQAISIPSGTAAPNYERYAMTTTTRAREEYSRERDRRGERSFFSDLYNAQRGDVGARARMEQFAAEERATSTASFAGLVVPQYLTEQAALLARAGRPFADSVQSLQIPEQGTTLLLPRGTTGASAAVQATENTSVSSTDEVWANVTLPVATIAGQQDVSRQSLERGVPGLDNLINMDLAGAYGVALDQQCLSGSGSSGQVLGVLNTAGISQATAFAAAATATTFWTKCAGQIAAVSTARGIAPDTIAMHPRRYAWLVSLVDTQGRPLVLPSTHGPANVMGQIGDGPAYGIATGQTFQGLDIVVDANIPTAVGSGPEDQVLIYRAADILLYEAGGGMPTDLRFEQTLGNQLTVKLVVYGYIAFTAGRYPSAVGVVGGNSASGFGLIAPTF